MRAKLPIIGLATCVAALVAATPAIAQSCKTWVGTTRTCDGGSNHGNICTTTAQCPGGICKQNGHGAWQFDGNWDPPLEPGPTECVDIPAWSKVTVTLCVGDGSNPSWGAGADCGAAPCPDGCQSTGSPDAYAASITLGANSQMDINPSTSLTIADDSTVYAEVRFFPTSKLKIDGTLTITGDGAEFDGQPYTGTSGRIEGVARCVGGSNDGETCSVPADCTGGTCTMPVLTIAGADSDPANFLLYGKLVFDVPVINNATVHANTTVGPIILNRDGNGGSGVWKVTGDGVELRVDGTTSGSAEWRVESRGLLTFNDDCTNLSGNLIIDGYLSIYQDFATTGNLELKTGRSINLAAGKEAFFD